MILGTEVKVGYVVQLVGDDATKGKFYTLTRVEGSDYDTGRTTGQAEFSTVAAGSTTGFKNIDRLEPDDNQIAWYHWYVKDGNEYQMKLKAGTIRFGPFAEPNVGYIDNEKSGPTDPNPLYGFWLFKDWYPSVQAQNLTPYTMTPKIWFEGLKFDMIQVIDPAEVARIKASGKYSIITLGGIENA